MVWMRICERAVATLTLVSACLFVLLIAGWVATYVRPTKWTGETKWDRDGDPVGATEWYVRSERGELRVGRVRVSGLPAEFRDELPEALAEGVSAATSSKAWLGQEERTPLGFRGGVRTVGGVRQFVSERWTWTTHAAWGRLRYRWWVLFAAVLPGLWVFRRLRALWRRKPGHCRVCNYDLRASPERCPECGTLAGAERKPVI